MSERYVEQRLRLLREGGAAPWPKPKKSKPRDSRKFWDKVNQGSADECWPWTGYTIKTGHGLTQFNHVSMYASRKAYILTHGPIDSGMCVNHRCDNAICCNPAHLYLGSRADNMVDRFAKVPAHERVGGRKRMMNDEQIEALWKMHRDGASMKECSETFGIALKTIYRYITDRRKLSLERLQARRHSV